MSRLLRALTYAALIMELHAWARQTMDRRMENELQQMCWLGGRP